MSFSKRSAVLSVAASGVSSSPSTYLIQMTSRNEVACKAWQAELQLQVRAPSPSPPDKSRKGGDSRPTS